MNNEVVTNEMTEREKADKALQAIRETRKYAFSWLSAHVEIENRRGIKTPKTIRLLAQNLEMILSFNVETEFTAGQFRKYSERMEIALLELQGKAPPKGSVHGIGESVQTLEQIQKRARLYLYRQFELSEMTREFENRKADLEKKISDVKSKIPLAQLTEFTDILVQFSPAYGDNTPIAKPEDIENEVEVE